MDRLMDLLVDPNERHGYSWMRMRIRRIWQRWANAIVNLSKKQDLTGRRQKKVLQAKLIILAASWENQQCGFRTGLTQTGLYSYRSRLEA